LHGNSQPLLIKAFMDALVIFSLVQLFGWTVLLAIVPMAAYQLTLTKMAVWIAPALTRHELMSSINATSGLLIFCVALIMLDLKKIELSDYLPSLGFAPLLTWLWR